MHSRWEHLKLKATAARKRGDTLPSIELSLGIPRSTLSGWFRDISLSTRTTQKIFRRKELALAEARKKAVAWHNQQKHQRLQEAKNSAVHILSQIPTGSTSHLELALAFLYLGEGSKNQYTSMGNSKPETLRFFITAIHSLYAVPRADFRCELHLRADQNPETELAYWSKELRVSKSCFGKTSIDQRTAGRPTYSDYHGVCVVRCGRVAIQRKLMYIAEAFCRDTAEQWVVSSVGRASA